MFCKYLGFSSYKICSQCGRQRKRGFFFFLMLSEALKASGSPCCKGNRDPGPKAGDELSVLAELNSFGGCSSIIF